VTATVRALLDHAFGVWELHRVVIEVVVDNQRSKAIPERLGFRREAVLREAKLIHSASRTRSSSRSGRRPRLAGRSGASRRPRDSLRPGAVRLSSGPALYSLGMASPEAKNLEAISQAIDQHNANCPFPAAEVRMNPFEVERLGWDHIRGLPVIPDGEIGTGRFRIVCSRDLEDDGLEITEAIGQELVTATPVQN
jgi:hypothetical protein